MSIEVKVGDFLTARFDLLMSPTKTKELSQGEKYEVLEISTLSMCLVIKNNSNDRHSFDIETLDKYFELGTNKTNLQSFNKYQELFEHMQNEHGVILLESELREIVLICDRITKPH